MQDEERHVCYRFIVSGRVQGVFYRDSTRQQALRLGLTGWVRNRRSGDVELIAGGDPDKINELEKWLWEGPQLARVTSVRGEIIDSHAGRLAGFQVRQTA